MRHPDARRAEDVPGGAKRQLEVADPQIGSIFERLQVPERRLRFLFAEEWERGTVFREGALVGVARVFLLNSSGIWQEYAGQRDRRRRRVNASSETVSHELWQVPGVIEVGVGEHDRVEFGGADWEEPPVAKAEILYPLVQPTIHEDTGVFIPNEKF